MAWGLLGREFIDACFIGPGISEPGRTVKSLRTCTGEAVDPGDFLIEKPRA